MKAKRFLPLILLTLTLSLIPTDTLLADAAPPLLPTGGDPATDGVQTQVRMVSEGVVITVENVPEGTGVGRGNLSSWTTRGHVEATFHMLNGGAESESFDVFFPVGGNDGWFNIILVDNFRAWVDGAEAEVSIIEFESESWDEPSQWAIWPVTFPPGQEVTLHVAYHTYPNGYSPMAEIGYILHTGYGWAGTIGEGTITVILPFEITRFNTVLDGERDLPRPADPEINGNEVTWRFEDLEPTNLDDISLTILEPRIWYAMQAAEAAVEENPDSWEAHLELARTRVSALSVKYVIDDIGASFEIARLAMDSYEEVIARVPENLEILEEYHEYLLLIAGHASNPYIEGGAEALARVEMMLAGPTATPRPEQTSVPITPTSPDSEEEATSTPEPDPTEEPSPDDPEKWKPVFNCGGGSLIVTLTSLSAWWVFRRR